jgi:starch synthase/alpha-amylase
MSTASNQPRILIITPEAVFVPAGSEGKHPCQRPSPGGFAAFLPDLINNLCEKGIDVHVAQPDYRRIFANLTGTRQNLGDSKLPADRLHLAEDRVFFYSDSIDTNGDWENTNIALNFQREISHQILPRLQPDLIHCHDWMTGLIPAVAKKRKIACLFSAYHFSSSGSLLARIEDRGIDAAAIWQYLYYDHYPGNYEETRDSNPVDFLFSAILSAGHVNTLSTWQPAEGAQGRPDDFHERLNQLLLQRRQTGCVSVMPPIGAPPESFRRQPCGQKAAIQFYRELYESILQRSLVSPAPIDVGKAPKRDPQKTTNGQALSNKVFRDTNSYASFGRRPAIPAIAF